ncbi:PAS domain-containing protein [bacterium]|nr:PAS domain-containing protein [bacterium]
MRCLTLALLSWNQSSLLAPGRLEFSSLWALLLLTVVALLRLEIQRRKLKASLACFRALAESLPKLVWSCDGQGRVQYYNPLWSEYGGLQFQPGRDWDWGGLIHPDELEVTQRTWRQCLQSGHHFEARLRLRARDGRYRWFRSRARAILDDGGRITGWVGSNTDIQELEVQVRERTEELLQVQQLARVGSWTFDIQSDRVEWTPELFRIMGLEEGLGAPDYHQQEKLLSPESWARVKVAVELCCSQGVPYELLVQLNRPDGRQGWGVTRGRICPDDPNRLQGTFQDVTELKASENLLREFIRHAPAAIAMLDLDMRYLQTSQRWLLDFKLGDVDLTGRSHYEVFPDLPPRWRAIHQRVLQGAVETCEEDPYPRSDGSIEWLQWECRPWRDGSGQIGGAIFFVQVITERKLLEMMILEQKAELERSNQELEQFAYVASHDLQEPLRAVAGCGQILQQRFQAQLQGQGSELIGHIVDGAARMQALIRDLLAYSRVNSRDSKRELVDCQQALQHALSMLEASIRENSAQIHFPALPSLPGDLVQLQLLFQNLLTNSLKYRSRQPLQIEIEVEELGNDWLFHFGDNGIGIESQYFERIFLIFQRLHTREQYPGNGLGLALCRKIVEGHGGKIWVTSEPGRGTTIHFTLSRGVVHG